MTHSQQPAPVSGSQPMTRKNSLARRLALWVTLLTVLVIAALGIYFDSFLRSSFLESARTRLAYGFERLDYNLQQVEASLKEGVTFLRVDDAALAAIGLIQRYEDRNNYNRFLLDEEKKYLADELLSKVKLSFNDRIVLYGHRMDVMAYVIKDDAGVHQLNIVSYRDGQPVLLRRSEGDALYQPIPFETLRDDGIHYQHVNFYSDDAVRRDTQISLHKGDQTLIVTSHLRLSPEDSDLVAHIEMSRVLDKAYFMALSGNMNLDIHLADQPGEHAVSARALRSGDQLPDFGIGENEAAYWSSMSLDTLDGQVFFNARMERNVLNKALSENRRHLLVLLLMAVIFALFWIREITHRRLKRPLQALMTQIDKVQRQDYSPSDVLQSHDELQDVSESINHLAYRVQERELSLEQSKKELEYLSDHDVLTGLANRRYWTRHLNRALQDADNRKQSLAVLFIDLDQFKQVNDTQGHDIGDKLLQAVAGRLQSGLQPGETLARIGGDEFNLLIQHLEDDDHASRVAQRVLKLFVQPFRVAGQYISISASIGVTLYPDDGHNSIELAKYADLAMYKAKDNGRNNFCFFSDELSEQMQERMALTDALRQALQDTAQFELYFQPKVSAYSGTMVGVEALIRWHHPELGLVSPAKFIPLAEELGLIIPLGEWVLEQGCRQFMQLKQQGVELDHISINVSSLQLDDDRFPYELDRILQATGIAPDALELEITESYIAKQPEAAKNRLHYFRERGVRLAVDDFGTGYSAMNTLQDLPITRIKIDKSFVDGLPDNPNSVALARAIVGLAKNFGLALTAEGVETAEQLAFLSAEHCEEIQGYYFSRPLPYALLLDFVRQQASQGQHSLLADS